MRLDCLDLDWILDNVLKFGTEMEPYFRCDRGTRSNKILGLKWEVYFWSAAPSLKINGAISGCSQFNRTFSLLTMLSICVWWRFLIVLKKNWVLENLRKDERQEWTSSEYLSHHWNFCLTAPERLQPLALSARDLVYLLASPNLVKQNVMTYSYHAHNSHTFFYRLFCPSTKMKLDLKRRH